MCLVVIEMFYADYLQQTGIPLFDGAGIYWRIYRKALIPAPHIPTFVNVNVATSRRLLAESKAPLMRWSSHPSDQETSWWWMVCDEYELSQFSSKIRNQIRRGYRECSVRRISAEWLAMNGYECYKVAYSRYRHAVPTSEDSFRLYALQQAEYEPLFEYWGVFVADQLVGYTECVVEGEKGVKTNIIKYDPDYLRYYTSYAMMGTLLEHYVAERGLTVSNGNRAVSHDTNVQSFLLKFGFRRQYCRLNVQYRHSIELAIQLLYPFRKFLPGLGAIHGVKSLLFQEELRRACQ